MSPEPYVRAQAAALGLLLLAEALLGSAKAALVLSLIAAAGIVFLRRRYKADLLLAGAVVAPHRERLDRIVDGDAQTLVGIGVAASAVMVGFHVRPISVHLAPLTPLLVAVAALVVYLSSLVDWFVILPRVSGTLGFRPCRAPEAVHPRLPRTWRETTRWWLVHRIAAALVLRFALAYALIFELHRYITMPYGTKLVAGAVLGFLASYLKAVPSAGVQAGHPTMIVGRTVIRLPSERVRRQFKLFGLVVPLPFMRRVATKGVSGEREWVYDVALEGVQLVPAAPREETVPRSDDGTVVYERAPTKIRLQDIPPLRNAEPFHGCRRECSGINWYCIQNPRCFEPK